MRVANTSSGKLIRSEIDWALERCDVSFKYYSIIECIEAYAVFQYLAIRERRKCGETALFMRYIFNVDIFRTVFEPVEELLRELMGLQSPEAMQKLAKSLVFPEFIDP